jgi:uncharacterized protein YqeY
MTLKQQISEDMKNAMRAKDGARLGAVRLLLAAIKQKEVDERDRTGRCGRHRHRRESCSSNARIPPASTRPRIAWIWPIRRNFEIGVLNAYMPQPFSAEEVAALIRQAVTETGAAGAKDMGKVIAWLKPKLAGRADMTARFRSGQGALG